MLNFPDNPSNNQVFTSGSQTWVYDGTKWVAMGVAGGSVKGVTDGSDAASGMIGEFRFTSLATTGIANAVASNILSLNLTAGDWDVEGNAQFIYATGAGATAVLAVSATAGSLGFLGGQARITVQDNSLNTVVLATGAQRFSLAATTTIYLVAFVGFTTSTCTVTAQMRARRMR